MAKMTKHDMLKLWLEEGSFQAKEIPSRNKYTMLEGVDYKTGKPVYFFLGSNGAIRFSSGKNAAKSTSWTAHINMESVKRFLDERGLLK